MLSNKEGKGVTGCGASDHVEMQDWRLNGTRYRLLSVIGGVAKIGGGSVFGGDDSELMRSSLHAMLGQTIPQSLDPGPLRK